MPANVNDNSSAISLIDPRGNDFPEDVNESADPGSSKSHAGILRNASRNDYMLLLLGVLAAAANGFVFPGIAWFMNDLFTAIFVQNPQRDEKTRRAVLTFLGLALAGFVTGTIVWITFTTFADRQMLRLRQLLFAHVLRQDVTWFDQHEPATLTTRLISDTHDFREGVGEKLSQIVIGICTAVGGFIVAFTRSWKLTLVLCLALPLVVASLSVARNRMEKFASQQQEAYAAAGGVAESVLSSIRTVTAFGGQCYETDRYHSHLLTAKRQGVLAGVANGLSVGSLLMLMYALYGLGFWFGRILVVDDMQNGCYMAHIFTGDLLDKCFNGGTMLSTLFGVIGGMMGLGMLAQSFAALASARSAAGRIFEILDQKPSIRLHVGDTLQLIQGAITFEGVRFAYPSRPDVFALDSFSLQIPSGKTTAMVGPSGSGKSTVVALIQRFYDPEAGAVLFDNTDVRSLRLSWLRQQMALVQQEPVLFSGSIELNIAYGKESGREDVYEAARQANAHNFISAFPRAYATEVGERGVQLSGGQKQRIAIARAIIRDPVVLLLDEATSALDTENELVVQAALDKLLQIRQRTTVVIAHRLSTVRRADQICVLSEGRLLERGTHDELAAQQNSLYAQLLALQQLTGVEEVATLTQQISSRSDGSTSSTGAQQMEDVVESPIGGAAPTPVPFRRLWHLNRKDLMPAIIGLVATVAVASSRPLLGNIFADAANLFTKDLAIHIMADGIDGAAAWVTANDNRYCLEFLGIGILLFFGYFLQVVGFCAVSESLTMQLRMLYFKAMLRQDMSWFDNQNSGALTERLATEVPLIRAFTGEQLATVVQSLCTMLVGLYLAFRACWTLTLAQGIFLPLLGLGILLVVKSRRVAQAVDSQDIGPLASEAIGNIRTVASLGLEARLEHQFNEAVDAQRRSLWRANVFQGFANGVTNAVVYIVFAGVFGLAVFFIDHSWMSPDKALKVFFPLMYSVVGVISTQTWAADRVKARVAVTKIFNTIDRIPCIDLESTSGEELQVIAGKIEFANIDFHYPSRPNVAVFQNVSFSIQAQTTAALVGPSGSGKSTVMVLILRFYDAQAGSILIDGTDIRSLRLPWLRAQMALVQQEPVLFTGSVQGNIAYGKEGSTCQEVQTAACLANAHDFISGFPAGYETEVGERGVQLSGGQKQRIAIARAIIRDPAVLLLDEATSALDAESERIVQVTLEQLLERKRRTTIIIAHRLSTVQNADRIFIISDGRVVEEGSHDELIRNPSGHYSQLVARSGQ